MWKSLDWRRGSIRLLIVLAVVYWLAASYWSFFVFYDGTSSHASWEQVMQEDAKAYDWAAFRRAWGKDHDEWLMTSWLGMGLSAGLFVLLILTGFVVRWVVRGFAPRLASRTSFNNDGA